MGDRRYIFPFPAAGGEEVAPPRALLGERGAIFAELSAAGLPVPPGFVISAEVGAYYERRDRRLPPRFIEEYREELRRLSSADGARFGDAARPLLLSLCAESSGNGARGIWRISHLGLSDRALHGLAQRLGGDRPAWDAYRRLLREYGVAIAGIPPEAFEIARGRLLGKYGVAGERDLDAPRLQELCDLFKRVFFERAGRPFPQDPFDQFRAALTAALARRSGGGGLGAALTVRATVFGQRGEDSGVARACSRDPVGGADRPVGVFLANAQEDDLDAPGAPLAPFEALEQSPRPALRGVHAEISALLRRLERLRRYPSEALFVIEEGRAFLLEAMPARRGGRAGVRWAVDMASAAKGAPAALSEAEALNSLDARDLEDFLGGTDGAPSLLSAFRAGAREARRHPDYRLYRQISSWASRNAGLRVYAEAATPDDLRLARRLEADGALLRIPAEDSALPVEIRRQAWQRRIETAHAAARRLPLIIEWPPGLYSEPPALPPGNGWLLETPDPDAGADAAPPFRSDGRAAPRGWLLATPRAALLADLAAERADFLALDIPRLHHCCRGRPSADGDAARAPEPLDIAGVGQLVEWAARKARAARLDATILALGVSPADTAGLRFLIRAGVTAVTASPAAVPAMRVAAAQASRPR